MSARALKILELVSTAAGGSKCYRNGEKGHSISKGPISEDDTQPSKMPIDEDSIWSREMSLTDMEKVSNFNFEYKNARDCMHEPVLSKLKETLVHKPAPSIQSKDTVTSITEFPKTEKNITASDVDLPHTPKPTNEPADRCTEEHPLSPSLLDFVLDENSRTYSVHEQTIMLKEASVRPPAFIQSEQTAKLVSEFPLTQNVSQTSDLPPDPKRKITVTSIQIYHPPDKPDQPASISKSKQTLISENSSQASDLNMSPAAKRRYKPADAYKKSDSLDKSPRGVDSLFCTEILQPSPASSLDFGSDDSVKDKDYLPEAGSSINSESISTPDSHATTFRKQNFDTTQEDQAGETSRQQDTPIIAQENRATEKVSRKKLGKRITIEEKKKIKNMKKYFMKPACRTTCSHMCTLMFTEAERAAIHLQYWSLNYEMRGMFIKDLVESLECERHRTKQPKRPRRYTNKYNFMKNEDKIEVCKTFFLCTLGYHSKNDRRVLTAIKAPATELTDKRDGRNLTIATVNKELLTAHVNSFNPCVHHYRRKHAPNRKYLPSDLTIADMYENFTKLHPNVTCSKETYRNHVSNIMKISFAKLGHEECETCEIFELHNDDHSKEPDSECPTCQNYIKHKLRYTNARQLYDRDVTAKTDEKTVIISADLQKVVMLPRIDTFKSAVFCPRLVAYNESFVPVGGFSAKNSAFAVLWHDGVSGRKQEDLISTFRSFLLHKRDAENIKIWLDNCSAQNKNWCLFTFLVQFANSDEIQANSIILSYFEPGHTFMSADSFHHLVEQSFDRAKKIYDFKDYVTAIAKAGKVDVKTMEVDDFYNYKDYSNQPKLKKQTPRVYLKDIVEVMVKKGDFDLHYKTDHLSVEYEKLPFLKNKMIPRPTGKTAAKGIPDERKKALMKTLGPLMPANRRSFWQNIPTSSKVQHLVYETANMDSEDE